jgi:hypothetical protein
MRNLAVILIGVLALSAGCIRHELGPVPPALPQDKVLEAHNAWADSVQHLWSRAAVTIDLPKADRHDERDKFDMDGHLMVVKPDNLFIHGQMPVIGKDAFKLGMNAQRFWLWVFKPEPDRPTMWTGRRGGPGERRFILAAEDVMTALGLFPIDLKTLGPAAFHVEPEQYVVTESREFAGRTVPWRRLWLDRRTLRPVRIDLFDEIGHRVLMSELLEYQRAGQTDVCVTYRARFYGDDEVDMALRLSGVDITRAIPPALFLYKVPEGSRVEDLDGVAPQDMPSGSDIDAP